MGAEHTPFNYGYFVGHAAEIGGRILDYGCGAGQVVAQGRRVGLDFWGTDAFPEHYAGSERAMPAEASQHFRPVVNGRADFPDAHFDVILSNQVLEHVTDPEATIADMHRLLKPGGVCVAAFPVIETWYEGHLGLYFAHRFPASRARHIYFSLSRRLGFGLYYEDAAPDEWARRSAKTLDDVCFYYPLARMRRAFASAFGTMPRDISDHYMRKRLGGRAAYMPAPILRAIYHCRAGQIFSIAKLH